MTHAFQQMKQQVDQANREAEKLKNGFRVRFLLKGGSGLDIVVPSEVSTLLLTQYRSGDLDGQKIGGVDMNDCDWAVNVADVASIFAISVQAALQQQEQLQMQLQLQQQAPLPAQVPFFQDRSGKN